MEPSLDTASTQWGATQGLRTPVPPARMPSEAAEQWAAIFERARPMDASQQRDQAREGGGDGAFPQRHRAVANPGVGECPTEGPAVCPMVKAGFDGGGRAPHARPSSPTPRPALPRGEMHVLAPAALAPTDEAAMAAPSRGLDAAPARRSVPLWQPHQPQVKEAVVVAVNDQAVRITVRDGRLADNDALTSGFETAQRLTGRRSALHSLVVNGRTLYQSPQTRADSDITHEGGIAFRC